MDIFEEEKFHKDTITFMDTENYNIGFAVFNCEKDYSELVNKLKSDGYEIFNKVITTGDNECRILYRRSKKPSP